MRGSGWVKLEFGGIGGDVQGLVGDGKWTNGCGALHGWLVRLWFSTVSSITVR
jgi:hypothetical protein